MEKEEIFPKIIQIQAQPGRAGYEKKCMFHERMLYHYLERKIDGWCVSDFLRAEKIEKYALYAVTDLTYLFIKDMERSGCGYLPETICDQNAERYQFEFKNRTVILPGELVKQYREGKIKKIVVMSVIHENSIIEDLQKRGILLNDLISFVSILYS